MSESNAAVLHSQPLIAVLEQLRARAVSDSARSISGEHWRSRICVPRLMRAVTEWEPTARQWWAIHWGPGAASAAHVHPERFAWFSVWWLTGGPDLVIHGETIVGYPGRRQRFTNVEHWTTKTVRPGWMLVCHG